ncbi:MAG: SDR family oxidoreductase [Vicinamibacteria bacterium]
MRVLVTGAGGVLGGRLAALLSGRHAVVAGHHRGPTPDGLPTVPLDVLSPASIEEALERSAAEAVVHAAALADPDRCEGDVPAAVALNTDASAILARLCHLRGLRLVALSTDLVFPGDGPRWSEDDRPGPLQAYGRTKLGGEDQTLAEHPAALVARVALVVGRGFGSRPTASESIAWNLRQGRRVRLFTDQFRTPVDPESLGDAISRLLEGTARGLLHLGGRERLSRHALGVRTARLLGLDEGLIDAGLSSEHQRGARRPPDVSLDSRRAMTDLGWTPRPLDDAILEGRTTPPTGS